MQNFIIDLIKNSGPISVSQFMNEALFNPKYGYYIKQNPFGKDGDFITAPEISQVFGELIGAYLLNIWQNNYTGSKINLVEMGAGRGTLMYDLLNFANKIPGFVGNVDVNIIEISPKLRSVQQDKLRDFNIKWWNDFDQFYQSNNTRPIFFVANELFDCFAINQYININGFWHERLLGLDKNGELNFILGQKNAVLHDLINKLTGGLAKNADLFEHSPACDQFMLQLASAIKKTNGVGIIIDYGYLKNNFQNSLQALRNNKYSNVLQDIGLSDITALVNFARLEKIIADDDLKSWVVTQKEFLESLGVEVRRQKLLQNKSKKEQDLINLAINRLIDKDQMGELFKVLILSQ